MSGGGYGRGMCPLPVVAEGNLKWEVLLLTKERAQCVLVTEVCW